MREFAENYAVGLALEATQVPVQDVMIWLAPDGKEPTTAWIRGNTIDSILMATRRGIVVPWNNRLWQWTENRTEVPLHDCNAVNENDDNRYKLSQSEGGSTQVVLVDLLSDTTQKVLGDNPKTIDNSEGLAKFESSVSPIASIGPYLFVKHQERWTSCTDGKETINNGFFVFD